MIAEILYSTATLFMFGVAAGLVYQYYLSCVENQCVINESRMNSEMLVTELDNKKINKHRGCWRRNSVHSVKKVDKGYNNFTEENNSPLLKENDCIRNITSSDVIQDHDCKQKCSEILFVEKNNAIADINRNSKENKILTKHINYEKFLISSLYEDKKILNINMVNTVAPTKTENMCNVSVNHASGSYTETIQNYPFKTERNCAKNSSFNCAAGEYYLTPYSSSSDEEIKKFDNTGNTSYENQRIKYKSSNKLSEVSNHTKSYNNVSDRNNFSSKKFINCNNELLYDNTEEPKLNHISCLPITMINGACNTEVSNKAEDASEKCDQKTQFNSFHVKEKFDSSILSATANNPLFHTSEIDEPWETLERTSRPTTLNAFNEKGNNAEFAERQKLYKKYMKQKITKTDCNVQNNSNLYTLFSIIKQNIRAKKISYCTKAKNYFVSQQEKFSSYKAKFKDAILLGIENNAEFEETSTNIAIEHSSEVFEDLENADIQDEYDMCKGCMEVVANVIYNPCGHCYLCMKCAVTVSKIYQKCCLCHTNIISFKEASN